MKKLFATIILSISMTVVPLGLQTASAIDLFPGDACKDADCSVVKTSDSELAQRVQNIINIALLVMGGVAVIMIIVGALRMIAANGDPGNIKSGRLTVLWSIVGVIVILLASAIVNFVVSWDWLK